MAFQPQARRSWLQGVNPSLTCSPTQALDSPENLGTSGERKEADTGRHRFYSHQVQSQAYESPLLRVREAVALGGISGAGHILLLDLGGLMTEIKT